MSNTQLESSLTRLLSSDEAGFIAGTMTAATMLARHMALEGLTAAHGESDAQRIMDRPQTQIVLQVAATVPPGLQILLRSAPEYPALVPIREIDSAPMPTTSTRLS